MREVVFALVFVLAPEAIGQAVKVPAGAILVKGAWSSSSDSTTPVPEGGTVSKGVYRNSYFGLTYPLPVDWTEKYKGPPPSDGGLYVLSNITPADTFQGPARGSILISAQDLFFSPSPAANAAEWIDAMKTHLPAGNFVEKAPAVTTIAGRPFTLFAYGSKAAQFHWVVLATEIRCHMVSFAAASRDAGLLDSLVQSVSRMNLAAQGSWPVCIPGYARPENMVARVNPSLPGTRFNPIPVRIVIDRQGNVKHIHFLSAFPEQAKAIGDALSEWRFKPYLRDGQPVEVETGIVFGRTAPAAGQ